MALNGALTTTCAGYAKRAYQVCWAPVGDWNAVERPAARGFNPEAHNITRVPEKLLEIWWRELPGLVDAQWKTEVSGNIL